MKERLTVFYKENYDMKIYSRLRLTAADDWFSRMSPEEQKTYIQEHPNSKYAQKKPSYTPSPSKYTPEQQKADKELRELAKKFQAIGDKIKDDLAPGLREQEDIYHNFFANPTETVKKRRMLKKESDKLYRDFRKLSAEDSQSPLGRGMIARIREIEKEDDILYDKVQKELKEAGYDKDKEWALTQKMYKNPEYDKRMQEIFDLQHRGEDIAKSAGLKFGIKGLENYL